MLLTSNFALAQAPKEVNMLWLNFSRPLSKDLLVNEIQKPLFIPGSAAAKVKVTDISNIPHQDPFLLAPADFYVGNYLPVLVKRDELERKQVLMPPSIKSEDAFWFNGLATSKQMPDVFVVAGHGVISEGFHNSSETKFLFLPTLLDTLRRFPSARQVFDNIKLAVLWGCNTMTNLEPHKADGSYMSPKEIYDLYHSGPEGKKAVIGTADTINTLEFYRSRLAREYGPNHPPGNEWEYTRGPKDEKCVNNETKFNCKIADVDRLMPDEGLWDGTHRYNYPYVMSKVFPHAALVLGYSSASPSEEQRVKILDATLKKSYADINAQLKSSGRPLANNILLPLIDPNTPLADKKLIVEAIRKNWTIETIALNRDRASGSISPLFPDLTKRGILGVPAHIKSNQYGPWREDENQSTPVSQPVVVPRQ